MGFEGYRLRSKLVLTVKEEDSVDPSDLHSIHYQLALFISLARTTFKRFDEIERIIEGTLKRYEKDTLTKLISFSSNERSLEKLGDFLYPILKDDLAATGAKLESLEISEGPLRTYIVNEAVSKKRIRVRDKRVKLSRLVMGNVISQTAYDIISQSETESVPSQEVVHSPEPVFEALPPAPEFKEPMSPVLTAAYEPKPVAISAIVACILILCLAGGAVCSYLYNTGTYPSGSDVYGHLFKSDLLYHSIKDGDWYPLYTDLWYNGIQPFRYWAPLPYYILAAFQFLVGGDVYASYLCFVFASIVVGGCGWLLWGIAYRRPIFCTAAGILWFFLPDNIRVFLSEGNIPRSAIAMFIPYLFFFLWMFVEHKKKKAIIPVVTIMSVIVMCHVMISAMIGITSFLLLLFYSILFRRVKESMQVLMGMLLSFALCGFWLFPALQGGLMGMDSSGTSEVMRALSTTFTVSLNPLLRLDGHIDYYYFSLAVFLLSIVGLLLAGRSSRPGFYAVLLIFLGTTPAMVPFLEKLPLNQLLWMTRFTPIVYAVFLLAVFEWKKSKRFMILLLCILLALDCIPSSYLYKYHSDVDAKIGETLTLAKEVTNQRLSLLDVSAFGSYPSLAICADEPKTKYSFGWAWQGASTSHNIVMVNTALERGYYRYLFDRSLELGDDTIIVRKDLVKQANKSLEDLVNGAKASGYQLYRETNYGYLFHINTPKDFGVSTKFTGLAIGRSAQSITLEYPAFEEGVSRNLNDYSISDLSRYKVIYLSGFQYDDREAAEKVLNGAAKAGTKLIIDMNQIPVDPLTNRMTFFDVTAQPISFSTQFPDLIYRSEVYEALPFEEEYSNWNTVYLDNMKNTYGYSWFQNKRLPFIGDNGNKNIVFMGYNVLFHAMETNDEELIGMMNRIIGVEPDTLPIRTIVPLKITREGDHLVILSSGGTVNTTIAYQDAFRSEQEIQSKNSLLYISEKRTDIELIYPYLLQGILVSMTGLFGILLLLRFIFAERGVKNEKKSNHKRFGNSPRVGDAN